MTLIYESLHNQHYIHLNIKPDNFALDIGKLSNQVFLINFGLTQLFHDPATCSHTMEINGSSTIGTICYSLINCHLGLTPSRHNDLKSLVYVIVYVVSASGACQKTEVLRTP
jgi:serine/threonine protein kinase